MSFLEDQRRSTVTQEAENARKRLLDEISECERKSLELEDTMASLLAKANALAKEGQEKMDISIFVHSNACRTKYDELSEDMAALDTTIKTLKDQLKGKEP